MPGPANCVMFFVPRTHTHSHTHTPESLPLGCILSRAATVIGQVQQQATRYIYSNCYISCLPLHLSYHPTSSSFALPSFLFPPLSLSSLPYLHPPAPAVTNHELLMGEHLNVWSETEYTNAGEVMQKVGKLQQQDGKAR